jgi:type I restriction enzyme R subunit
MTTDTSEKGLETLIMRHMTGLDGLAVKPNMVAEAPASFGGIGWFAGCAQDFDRAHALDVAQLFAFLRATQPEAFRKLAIADANDAKDINRVKFLARLSSEIGKRGVIDVQRKGIEHHPAGHFDLFYGTPSAGNARAVLLHAQNRFSITRQLAYSSDETRRALDLCQFINGLPIATFELKNSLTKQTVEDAVEQYRRDRDPRERLFGFGRCVVHFAVDDSEVRMCTELKGKASWFLPFNKGCNDGAGNPPNPRGLKTDYLWREVLTPAGLTDILENYAQIVETRNEKTGKKKRTQIFPRYHQLGVVRQALADVRTNGAGKRYLVQHSAGSGKSNSIAWLAHQLIGVKRDGREVFDSVIVITDRRILDDQIQKTIRQFMQVGATVGHAEHSGDLRKFIEQGKKIIVTTVQKFPFILDEIALEGGRTFALLIDEAHSSQGGKTSAAVSTALGAAAGGEDEETDAEDTVNLALAERMAARKMLSNASYFAFTATPKNKTLEMFGEALPADAEGRVRHRPFHAYTMKQAIEERFILDVLKTYTPVASYYKLVKKIEDDPLFDTTKAKKKLRRYVEGHEHAIRLKAEIMVDHFHEQVLAAGKIGGQARAMVVTSGIERAIQYAHAFSAYLAERKSPYRAIVAFSGEFDYGGTKVTEPSLNGFSSRDIADRIQSDPYRFLICADKFQTGYDEPLLHTMYVDKPLAGIKAVQTLSRLNRAHPQKHDCFVLDFRNSSEAITFAFQDYYRTTLLAEETDPNKLHDLKAALDNAQVYLPEQVQQVVELFLAGADRDRLDPILRRGLQGKARRGSAGGIQGQGQGFLPNLRLPGCGDPAQQRRVGEDFDLLEPAHAQAAGAEGRGPGEGHPRSDRHGQLPRREEGGDEDRAGRRGCRDRSGSHRWRRSQAAARARPPEQYPQDLQRALRHAVCRRRPGRQALAKVMQLLLKDDTQVYKQFVENDSFKRFVGDMVFAITN